jgi:cell fate (sporulation/competence/biofilm development) regulator YlbF (YheA/YmcA/DUF963 family)
MSIDDEIIELENQIRTLETNDDSHKEINNVIKDGMTKGLIYDFYNPQNQYRATMFSTDIIKIEEYENFQKYINKCEKEEYDKYLKWKQDIIDSGIEFSKDELKYNKMI